MGPAVSREMARLVAIITTSSAVLVTVNALAIWAQRR
jgi:hypothetical protein